MTAWAVERSVGPAADHHRRPLPDPVERAVWARAVDRPALVLGSTQPDGLVDAAAVAAAGVDLVRRHSGGGAVLLHPGGQLWLDVLVPAGDDLWRDDVGAAFHWLGETWAGALAELGVDAQVHHGPMERSAWSGLICYAGRGPGEVFVDGAKVVGIAQRRTRAGARFQCAALLEPWDPAPVLDFLDLDPEDRRRGAVELTAAARGLELPAGAVLDAFVAHLP